MKGEYTKEEMQTMIDGMLAASDNFYATAQRIGNHPFIEFTGMMVKYINLCQNALAAGQQFPFASKHSGNPLPVYEHDVTYLAEKFDCIFGACLKNPEMKAAFFKEMEWETA